MNDKELKEIFAKAGKKNGYTDVDAVFEDHTEFKVAWDRTYRCCRFRVSDYLDKAPEIVIRDLADTMFKVICNTGPEPGGPLYPPAMRDYLMSGDFRELKTGIWVTRHDAEAIPRLQEHVEGLMKDNGLKLNGLKVFGGKEVCSSPVFRTLILPEQTPDYVIIYNIVELIRHMKEF